MEVCVDGKQPSRCQWREGVIAESYRVSRGLCKMSKRKRCGMLSAVRGAEAAALSLIDWLEHASVS